MEIRSITSAHEIQSFRLRQTIQTEYRDRPDLSSTTELLIEARRDPPAIQTTNLSSDGPPTVTLTIDNALWTHRDGRWSRTDVGDVPDEWTLRIYRELGDMSLAAPISVQSVVDAAGEIEIEKIEGVALTRYSAGTDLMVRLSTEAFEARQANPGPAGWSPAPLDDHVSHYEANFWIDSNTGFVLRERTVIEYSDERLHGQVVGAGPATFTTTREFFDFNAEIDILTPQA